MTPHRICEDILAPALGCVVVFLAIYVGALQ
jgi:hypothetical protein